MAAETGSKAGPQRESITDAGKSQKSGPVFNFIKIMKEQGKLEFAIRTLPSILTSIGKTKLYQMSKRDHFQRDISFGIIL